MNYYIGQHVRVTSICGLDMQGDFGCDYALGTITSLQIDNHNVLVRLLWPASALGHDNEWYAETVSPVGEGDEDAEDWARVVANVLLQGVTNHG